MEFDLRGRLALPRSSTASTVLLAWASSRALFLVSGAFGAHRLQQAQPIGLARWPGLLDYWGNWDGAWFSSIAELGYLRSPWPASTNFFPIYPLTIRIGLHVGAGPALAGVCISLVASLFATYFVHELARDLLGREAAHAAALVFAFFPTAFFLNAEYSEALFLALAVGAVWAARVRRNFLLAAVLGCLAAATRNVGVFLVLPLAHEWLRQRRQVGWPGLTALALVPAGLLGYMFWLWRWSSHPLLFATVVRQTWGRKLTNPVHTLSVAWTSAGSGARWAVHPERVFDTSSVNPSVGAMNTFNLIFLGLLLVLLAAALVRLPVGLSAYALLAGLVPVLTPAALAPLASVPRYFLAAFPVFLVLGDVLARNRVLLIGWTLASACLGVLLTLYFTSWRWVA
jgi:Mannosyltransferase (PIG-V)